MQIGDKIGRYTLERPLGEGGMGAVYLAYDPQNEVRVVLKLLPADLSSPEMEARFRREVKSIAQIDHPHAVKVLDFNVTKELCFYTMPYIPAMDLARYVQILKGPDAAPPPSSFPRLQSILVGVARALAHCHEREIYHRDIKPENILVETKSHAGILADFGLARSANLTNITRTRQMLGTLRYMSPELMQGTEAGAGSDLYQMGLVAYEIFSGVLPLEGETPQQSAMRRMTETVPSPRAHNPVISADLANLALWTLAVDPKQRPPDMQTFADALEQLDPVDQAAVAQAKATKTPGTATRSISIPNLSRAAMTSPGDATVVGPPPVASRSMSDPPTTPGRSSSQPGAAAPSDPGTRNRSGPNLGGARSRVTTASQRLQQSKQLSQQMVVTEIRRRERMKKLMRAGAVGGVIAVVLAIGGFAWWTTTPHGLEVRPGFQDVEVLARGPEFQLELKENGALRTTAKPQPQADGSWKASVGGLKQDSDYSVAWVTPSGRRSGSYPFHTREVKVTDVSHSMKEGAIELSFKTSIPVRAVALLRGAGSSVDLDGKLATEHTGGVPLSRMRATELVVELTDATGAVASIPVGDITSPQDLARKLELTVNRIDLEQAFMRIHGSTRGVPEVARMLAKDFREGPYHEVIEAFDRFRPAGGAYFDDPDLDLAERIKMYDTLGRLTQLSALLAVEKIPLEFPVDRLLGATFATSTEDQLPNADPIRLEIPREHHKLQRNMKGEFKYAGKIANDILAAAGRDQLVEDHVWTVPLTDVKTVTRAEMMLQIHFMNPLAVANLEINGRMKLMLHCPGFKKIDATPPLRLYHAFDPKLLKDGDNQIRLSLGYLSKLEFSPLEVEGAVLKVERAPAAH